MPTSKRKTTRKRKPANTLAEYKSKRDFTKTREPAGAASRARSKSRLRFVVQKHAATSLHFDLRLELDGVMKSWAVPKGPSYDPSVKRLAMEVEDHPIEYNKFEGTIPEGEYGAGTVMIWDRGTYEAEDGGGVEALRDGYAAGDLKIRLHGERLAGGWVLVRMRRSGKQRQWLLIKHRDEFAMPTLDVVADVITSVKSGRTMDEISEGKKARSVKAKRPARRRSTARKKTAAASR